MAALSSSTVSASRRVAIVASDAGRLVRLRGPLIRAIRECGHQVLCLTALASGAEIDALQKLGATFAAFDPGAERLRALGDRRAIDALGQTLATSQPNVIIGIGMKPMVMAGLASRHVAAARVVLIAPFVEGLPDSGMTALPERWLWRRALRAASVVIVHNAEHEKAMRQAELLRQDANVRIVSGCGVDIAYYCAQPLPDVKGGLVFAMLARSADAGGVAEFCEAARRVKTKTPAARFLLCLTPAREGGRDGAPGLLERFGDAVEVSEAQSDVRAALARCHVFVLPTQREGLAHELIEAFACGRPAIATAVPGSREIVDERVSGVLVPPRDVQVLVSAMESFVRRPDQLAWMGLAARRKVERRFDAREINRQLLALMGLEQTR